MAFLINEQFTPPDDAGSEVERLTAILREGEPHEKQAAAERLSILRAEVALTGCLAAPNEVTAQLATAALWECWFNERGSDARRELDRATELMAEGRLEAALDLFARLGETYPDWAEPINKQATVLYMLGNSLASLRLCRKVVELKPNHFGAWNGRALCAAQLEKWREALKAAREAHRLLPTTPGCIELIRIAEDKLREG
jgi:tetratricopeptide (TPR) repeat protein